MHLEGFPLVRSFDVVLGCVSFDTEYLIKIRVFFSSHVSIIVIVVVAQESLATAQEK
jgi:hypothetical protein